MRDAPTETTARVDIKAVARAALDRSEAIAAHWLPEGKRQGHEWIARNPTRTDHKPGSFSVNMATGAWSDFATGDKGGDLVSLIRYLDGLPTQGEAARRLADWLGIAPAEPRHCNGHERPTAPETNPRLSPIPTEALATRPQAHTRHGAPSAEWRYCDAKVRPLCCVLRFDPPEGRKQFAPLTWDGSHWQWKAPPEPRPLYGLDRLAARPDAPVLLCEGEKASDAAADLVPECITVATMNGAQSPKKSDWAPIQGRHVRIWPDHDDPGAQYAQAAAALAYGAGAASVEILDLSALADDLPPGWDAADAVADGWTAERIGERARWIEIANPYAESEGTEGTASNGAASSGSPGENHEGTEGTAQTKPPVNRPCFAVHEARTGYGPPGLYWHGRKEATEAAPPKETDQWICSPLHADAMTASARDTDHGLLLRFQNAAGRWREWSMPMALLKGSGEELRGELLALGVRIDPASHRLLNAYLMSRYPKRRPGGDGDGDRLARPRGFRPATSHHRHRRRAVPKRARAT